MKKIILASILWCLATTPVYAVGCTDCTNIPPEDIIRQHIVCCTQNTSGITNPALGSDLGTGNPINILNRFFGSWWGVAYTVAGIVFLLYLIWGGIEWAVAGSNKERVENAKNKITNAMIGLVLIVASYALVKIVGFIFGLDVLETLKLDVSKLAP